MSNKKITLGITVPLIVIVAAGIIIPAWPASYKEIKQTELCTNCGIIRHLYAAGHIDAAVSENSEISLKDTELSKWFAAHISNNCDHQWQYMHSSQRNFAAFFSVRWNTSSVFGSGYRPQIVFHLDKDERTKLEELVIAGEGTCQEYISSRLRIQFSAEQADDRAGRARDVGTE